jgi:hypothetical protein
MFLKHKSVQEKWKLAKEELLKAHAFKEFLSEASEWHALWIGFYSAFYKMNREKLPDYLRKDVENEFHYYTFGFFIGRVIQTILAICGIVIEI